MGASSEKVSREGASEECRLLYGICKMRGWAKRGFPRTLFGASFLTMVVDLEEYFCAKLEESLKQKAYFICGVFDGCEGGKRIRLFR